MDVWTTEAEANRGLDAIRNAKKAFERGEISEEDYKKLRQEIIGIALKSYSKAKTHFFEYLPDP